MIPGHLTVVVSFPAKPGDADKVVAALKDLRRHLSALDSHVHSVITHDLDDPDTIVFVETYAEPKESFVSRLKDAPWFGAFDREVEKHLRGPRRVRWLANA